MHTSLLVLHLTACICQQQQIPTSSTRQVKNMNSGQTPPRPFDIHINALR